MSKSNLSYLDLMQCSITDTAVKQIANSCHKLEHFDIYGCGSITDSGIRAIVHSYPKLKHLELGNCKIDNSAIREIVRSCHNLKYHGLGFCKGISRNVVEKLDWNIEIEWPDSDSDSNSVQDLSDPE